MAETYQFALPLVAGAQAQKHVTVNEGLSILDAVTQLRIASDSLMEPPILVTDGIAYLVPQGASGDWQTHAGDIAIGVNGGWRYTTPRAGWQAFNEDTGVTILFDGTEWRNCAMAVSQSGAATEVHIVDLDHTLDAGSSSDTVAIIPQRAQVIGVSGRITEAFTGTFQTWSLGVADDPLRYGNGLGGDLNTFVSGLSGSPVTYYSDTSLRLTASGGDFASGVLRLAVHYMALSPPRPV